MKRFFNLILFSLLFTNFLYAQSARPSCPTISVEGPNRTSRPGEKIPFKVVIGKEFDSTNLKYLWSVSNGEITQGQGTTSISVENTKDSYTVTVEVTGLPGDCIRIASESAFYDLSPQPVIIADYWKIKFSEEKGKLDVFSKALQADPYSIGHFRKVFPRGLPMSAACRNLRQILNHLKSLGVDETRLTFGLAFGEKEFTQIFIVPAGAPHPKFDDEILDATQLTKKLKTSNDKLPR